MKKLKPILPFVSIFKGLLYLISTSFLIMKYITRDVDKTPNIIEFITSIENALLIFGILIAIVVIFESFLKGLVDIFSNTNSN